jgi:hypothetical protein
LVQVVASNWEILSPNNAEEQRSRVSLFGISYLFPLIAVHPTTKYMGFDYPLHGQSPFYI